MITPIKNYFLKFINLKLRTRLIVIASSFVALTSLFVYFYIINLQRNLFTESFLKSAENSFETVKIGMEEILTLESYETLEKIFAIAKNEKHFQFMVLTNQYDEIIASFPDSLDVTLKNLHARAAYSTPRDSVYILSSSYKSKLMNGELFVGYSTKEVRIYERKILVEVGIINIIVLAVLIVVIVFVSTGITTPLEKLRDASDKIRLGDFTSRADENKGGIEVDSVSKAFNLMVDKLTSTQKELESELFEAGSFVMSILPDPIDTEVKVEWRFFPTRELGGDAFGYHYLDNNNLAIYLIDASGHGVGSALLSVSAINFLRMQSLLNTDFYNPSSVLSSLNEIFQMERNGEKYFTMWYGVLNITEKKLIYSSAGHPPALLIRQNNSHASELIKLEIVNNFIGFMPEVQFESKSFKLNEKDTIYVYSDGIYELLNDDGKIISQSEFNEAIYNSNKKSLDEILLNLRSMQKDDVFTDDCALIRIRIK